MIAGLRAERVTARADLRLAGVREAQGELLLRPIAFPRVAMSRELIECVMREVRPDRALIAAAGACREIPLAALAQRFEAVVL